MFFKKNTCSNCNSRFDEMADFCPFCGARNEANKEFKSNHLLTFIPWYKELTLALIGLVGFQILSVIFSLVFYSVYQSDQPLGSTLINTAVYLAFFVIGLILIFPYRKDLLNKFKIPLAYVLGMAGFMTLLGFSVGYGFLIDILRPSTGEGGNQQAVTNIVVAYPIISIIVIGIIGPICEELAYRVGLFSLFRRVHPSLAYIAAPLIFGLIHFDFTNPDLLTELIYLVEYAFAGLVFCFLYEKKGFFASTTAHVLNNLFSIMMILLVANGQIS